LEIPTVVRFLLKVYYTIIVVMMVHNVSGSRNFSVCSIILFAVFIILSYDPINNLKLFLWL
jgi:heme/copper-type cytochrome/quinol oxidase subunit 4